MQKLDGGAPGDQDVNADQVEQKVGAAEQIDDSLVLHVGDQFP